MAEISLSLSLLNFVVQIFKAFHVEGLAVTRPLRSSIFLIWPWFQEGIGASTENPPGRTEVRSGKPRSRSKKQPDSSKRDWVLRWRGSASCHFSKIAQGVSRLPSLRDSSNCDLGTLSFLFSCLLPNTRVALTEAGCLQTEEMDILFTRCASEDAADLLFEQVHKRHGPKGRIEREGWLRQPVLLQRGMAKCGMPWALQLLQ